MIHRALSAIAPLLMLAACATAPGQAALPQPQEAFWQALSSHCGQAYAGALASSDARDADFAGRAMVAHWAECSADRIAIAFHVEDANAPGGWDRSRTWVVSRDHVCESTVVCYGTLLLQHDHRHADGAEDAVTLYGGTATLPGTARAQGFTANDFSIALFEREGLSQSLTNVWQMEADPAGEPGARLAYQLTRGNDPTRLFRVEFDLTRAVTPPPPAWGW